jgi:hypothetical protein
MKKYRRNKNRRANINNRSHLQRHLQNQSVRNLILGIGGIIAMLVIAFTIGPDLLINLSLHFQKDSKTAVTKESTNSVAYIEPPSLDDTIEATNSASTTIQGSSLPGQTIKLYNNGKFTDKTTVKQNSTFTFTDVNLEKGTNQFTAKAEKDNKQSNNSAPITIKYIDKPPSLDISNPQDGQIFAKGSNTLKVTGKTDADVTITVNDARAITNGDGSFSYVFKLNDGDNTIKVVATDDANNKTEKEIKIKVE